MTPLDGLLRAAENEVEQQAIQTLLSLLETAKGEKASVIQEAAQNIERWFVMRASGELDDEEFADLIYARQQVVQQFLNTQEIKVRAKLEDLTSNLIELALSPAISSLLKTK